MNYKFGTAIILTTSVLFSQSVGYVNAEEHQSEQTENTSKSISFEQAQKMNPKELTGLLTDEDLKLHNKDAEENSTEIESNQHINEVLSKC
ncbi:hypothetical protein NIT60_01225 [Mammaliicoccus sciuri]|nr:hypothetical protein NIT60_01225 [Mammaliicoccus sciuri]